MVQVRSGVHLGRRFRISAPPIPPVIPACSPRIAGINPVTTFKSNDMNRLILLLGALMILTASADASVKKRKTVHRKHTTRHAPARRTSHARNTSYRFRQTDAGRPSPYKGDNVPENDGQRKNKQRNMNYGNGQPLPPNDGGRR